MAPLVLEDSKESTAKESDRNRARLWTTFFRAIPSCIADLAFKKRNFPTLFLLLHGLAEQAVNLRSVAAFRRGGKYRGVQSKRRRRPEPLGTEWWWTSHRLADRIVDLRSVAVLSRSWEWVHHISFPNRLAFV